MWELLPVAGGLVLGVVAFRTLDGRARLWTVVVGALAIAVLAGLLSGELARSAGYLLVDTPETLAAAGVGIVLARAVRAERQGRQA
jgi:uncharacterized protein involved in response to NO